MIFKIKILQDSQTSLDKIYYSIFQYYVFILELCFQTPLTFSIYTVSRSHSWIKTAANMVFVWFLIYIVFYYLYIVVSINYNYNSLNN